MKRSIGPTTDGPQTVTTKTETVKVIYGQNWPADNAAQTEEKAGFRYFVLD
jgi:hypothetical protein